MSIFKNKNINYKLLEAFPGRDLLVALLKKYFRGLKKHIKPGGHVVIQENTQGGMDLETFRPMIEDNGGKIIDWVQSKDVTGKTNPMFYLVSQW